MTSPSNGSFLTDEQRNFFYMSTEAETLNNEEIASGNPTVPLGGVAIPGGAKLEKAPSSGARLTTDHATKNQSTLVPKAEKKSHAKYNGRPKKGEGFAPVHGEIVSQWTNIDGNEAASDLSAVCSQVVGLQALAPSQHLSYKSTECNETRSKSCNLMHTSDWGFFCRNTSDWGFLCILFCKCSFCFYFWHGRQRRMHQAPSIKATAHSHHVECKSYSCYAS